MVAGATRHLTGLDARVHPQDSAHHPLTLHGRANGRAPRAPNDSLLCRLAHQRASAWTAVVPQGARPPSAGGAGAKPLSAPPGRGRPLPSLGLWLA